MTFIKSPFFIFTILLLLFSLLLVAAKIDSPPQHYQGSELIKKQMVQEQKQDESFIKQDKSVPVGAVVGRANQPVAFLGDEKVVLEVVNTPEKLSRGLSGRKELAQNSGMLFVFESAERHGFWMKEMNFPIDIIWIDEAGKIVDIKNNVSPTTYPKSFYPQAPAFYVLEVNAGFTLVHGVKIGDRVSLEL